MGQESNYYFCQSTQLANKHSTVHVNKTLELKLIFSTWQSCKISSNAFHSTNLFF